MQVAADHHVTIQNGDPKGSSTNNLKRIRGWSPLCIIHILSIYLWTTPKAAIDRLVAQYERLFGKASHEVCREAAASLIRGMPQADVPASLLA